MQNTLHSCNTDWYKVENDTIICELCPRNCLIKENYTGFCGSRRNLSGKLYTLSYGHPACYHTDPVEKKPLYHFYPGQKVASIGTVGCNLACKFCQNWSLSQERTIPQTKCVSPDEILKDSINNATKLVAFTYNEPITWAEYALDIAQRAHELGLKTIAVTAGYINPKPRKTFFDAMDAANVDLKGFNPDFYPRFTQATLTPILDTLIELAHKPNFWLEITTLCIPNENTDPDTLNAEFRWIARELGSNIPLHLSAFYPNYKMCDRAPTTLETLQTAQKIALDAGLNYVYLGNIAIPTNTYCPSCKHLLIQRLRYNTQICGLYKNTCQKCGQIIHGCF